MANCSRTVRRQFRVAPTCHRAMADRFSINRQRRFRRLPRIDCIHRPNTATAPTLSTVGLRLRLIQPTLAGRRDSLDRFFRRWSHRKGFCCLPRIGAHRRRMIRPTLPVRKNVGGARIPNYRRALVPGGEMVFTMNLLERRGNDLLVRHIDVLRASVRRVHNSILSPSMPEDAARAYALFGRYAG